MSATFRAILNIVALAAVIFVNYLANALPLNGQTTGELSAKYNVLITPAGYVFSIWGLIYLLLTIWVIVQVLPKNRDKPVYESIGLWFVLNCILNCTWIFVWHYEFLGLSWVVMIGLLLSLIMIYTKIQNQDNQSPFVRLPFSVYLGWISVATIVNTAVVLKYSGWNGFGFSSVTWTVIMLLVGTGLAIFFTLLNKDVIYPLVFVWAYVGIGVRHKGEIDVLTYTSFTLAILLLLFIIWKLATKRNGEVAMK
ncbi:TspO/MBR family protein [Fictibacillus phosphorivorans]|uniref:TspO/MBR family protein n=1 Tax=Fictibacillus phosphorivorans TaxID=1221500 RepID=UPI0012935BF5|nr:TspO/MBR family protein [Fictibacillus phosphorivorans]MQR96304.1 tryptophan-rich sensory protein [Fictibacillus phosphorivorans]